MSKLRRLTAAVVGMTVVLGTAAMAAPALASTNTYYVSVSGSDANDGLTLATPFATISRCATVALAGDTCLIRGGTYR